MSNADGLERAVLSTLTWFELSHQPITAFECWHYLWSEQGVLGATPGQVELALHTLSVQGLVKAEAGFWSLASGEAMLSERQQRARFSIAKRQRAQRASKLIAALPFVRLVALVNTVAYEAPEQDSDIDIFIVAAPEHLWFTRFLVTMFTHLTGWRRHGRKVKNRLCLSFFVTERAMGFSSLRLKDDPYLTYWVSGVLPLRGATYEDFMRANAWIGGELPNRLKFAAQNVPQGNNDAWLRQAVEKLLEGRLGIVLERLAKNWQLKRHRNHPNSRLWQGGTAVIVNDDMMKFHETDQREFLARAFRQRLSELRIL